MKLTILALLAALFCTTAAFAGNFNDNNDGTVTDLTTKLVWQQCSAGLSGTNCATGAAGTYTWKNAITYCEGLSFGGFTDWRLPNFKELQSISDPTRYSPAINITYFPATQSSTYWSSTTYANETTDAWTVYFSAGWTYGSTVNGGAKTNAKYVRCVRGGVSSANFARIMRGGSPVKNYARLQDAYDNALGGDTIQALAMDFSESLTLSNNVSVLLEGGFDSGFTSNPDFTTVTSLTISSGTVTVENVRLK
jgi:hypothetical protein